MPKAKKSAKAKKSVKAKKKTSTLKKHPKKKIVKKTIAKRKPKKVTAIPKGYHSITPYLTVSDAAGAIAFYKKAFGAKEIMRFDGPNGKIAHAEIQIGDSKIMLGDECPEGNARTPGELGGSPVGIHLYIKDVDGVVKRAIANGAKATRPVQDMFYGDRAGGLVDPYGHNWYVSTHIEDVTPAKMKKRIAELFGKK
ncbi:MAG: VOC family protein [Gammaproteobacteria bacterium]